jgi:hypothetical protein
MKEVVKQKNINLLEQYKIDGYHGLKAKVIYEYYGKDAVQELLLKRQLYRMAIASEYAYKYSKKNKEVIDNLSLAEKNRIQIIKKEKNKQRYELTKKQLQQDETKQQIKILKTEFKNLERKKNDFLAKNEQIPGEILERYTEIKKILAKLMCKKIPFLNKDKFNIDDIILYINNK